jgi:hypothetical protein
MRKTFKEDNDMRRSFVGVCLVVAFASAAWAEDQRGNGKVITATGCLEQGSRPQSFVLRQDGEGVRLAGSGAIDLRQYIGRKVQVLGVVGGRGGPEEHGRAAGTRMTVREIRPVAGTCAAAQPTAGSTIGTPGSAGSATPASVPGPTPPQGATTTTTTTTGTSGQTGVSGDALLDGLINFNIQQLLVSIQFVTNVQDTVINVTDVLNDFQIQALVQALNSNPVASLNASELSLALQQSGVLTPGEAVVGVTPPTIRDNQTLTKALQQQGILMPGERVVGAKGARVYKMRD